MKVLQVNVVYKKGSTGKIVYDLHNELQQRGIESIVCYGRGEKIKESNVYKISSEILAKFNGLRSRITGLQYNGSFIATNKLIRIINKEKPDVVHLHCINGYFVNIYKLLKFLKVNNINTVLTLHAEFMYTGSCGHSVDCINWKSADGCKKCPILKEATKSFLLDRTHIAWKKMKEAFKDFNNIIVTSVSPWLMDRAKESIILSDKKHCTVLNGINTREVFYPCDFEFLKKKHKITDEKILLHVTANFTSEFKGGKYIIELAKRFKDKNIKIIVIGNQEKDLDLPSNIIDIGRITDQKELAAYYSMADLTVITSKRETFSMVCAESLACGTPIVGFMAGAPEQISLPEYSNFVEYGDINSLGLIVYEWIERKMELSSAIMKKGQDYYSKEKMCENYLYKYKELTYRDEE